MEVAHIHVSGTQAHPGRVQPIPAGIVGAFVRMSYTDDPWDGLIRNVVFRHEGKSVVILNAGKTVQLPAELVAEPSRELVYVGVCGVDANDTVLIPTLWAKIGPVNPSPSLSGEPAADPSLPIWAQLQQADARIEQKADSAKSAADNAKSAADNAKAAADNAFASAQAAAAAAAAAQQTADGGIQAPLTAKVGQIVKVADVDENGKPIEWEAADMISDEHINSLIDAKLGVIENGYY